MGLIDVVIELVDIYNLNRVCPPSLRSCLHVLGVVEGRQRNAEDGGHGGSEHSARRHFLVPARDTHFGCVWLQLGAHVQHSLTFTASGIWTARSGMTEQ